MIELYGPPDTAEMRAAEDLKKLLVAWDPGLEKQGNKRALIVANAKCPGQQRTDMDVLLFLSSQDPDGFPPVERNGKQVIIQSLIVVIEVKDHPPEHVRFMGNCPQVWYAKDGWVDAAEQVHQSTWSFKKHIEFHGLEIDPFVAGVGWLRQVASSDIPSGCPQFVGSDIGFKGLIASTLVDWDRILKGKLPPRYVNAADTDSIANIRLISELFVRITLPTRLDRRKLEALSSRWLDDQAYVDQLGQKMLVIKGAPGTGKTIALLRIARDLIKDRDARILFLTYNNALITDLGRLLSHEPRRWARSTGASGIHFSTVDSFIKKIADTLNIGPRHSLKMDYSARHKARKADLLVLLDGDSSGYAEEIVKKDPDNFSFDFVLIDEGQDWPQDECRILRALYGYQRLIVATGNSQMQRTTSPADWTTGLLTEQRRIITLKKVRRLCAGLCDFANAFGRATGVLTDDMEPDRSLPGGRVIIVQGDYFSDRELHDELVKELRRDGNELIDILVAVPAKDGSNAPGGPYHSRASRYLTKFGFANWDGACKEVRKVPPKDANQIRIVNHMSVRGLEGWTVVALGVDQHFNWLLTTTAIKQQEEGQFITHEQACHDDAARQLMIPLTRAVKTLVIEIRNPNSPVVDWLKQAHLACSDFVEWRIVGDHSLTKAVD